MDIAYLFHSKQTFLYFTHRYKTESRPISFKAASHSQELFGRDILSVPMIDPVDQRYKRTNFKFKLARFFVREAYI